MEKPRHFPLRHDLWDHPRTSWMYPDDLAVFALISSASILGVCTYSEKKIAKKTKVHLDKVPMVLHALQDHGIVKWWPEDEIVWSIERVDEAQVGGLAMIAAQREWREYPEQVQEAIAVRYPRITEALGDRPSGVLSKPLTEGGRGTPTVTVTVTVTVTNAAKRVLAHLNTRRQEVVPGARNLEPTKSNLKEIVARLGEGESEETLMAVVDAAADDVRGKPEHYRWLNASTPFRASNLPRYVALADKPRPTDEGGWL